MKKIFGTLFFGLARFLDLLFGGLIQLLSFAVGLVENIRQLFLPMLGCFGVFIMSGGIFMIPFMSPRLLLFIMILLIFPFLGKTFVSFLDYGRYILTEYLYDRADYYRLGKNTKKEFKEYGPSYRHKKMKEEEERRRRAQAEQNAQWEEIFRSFYEQAGYRANRGGGYGYTGQSSYGQTGPNQGAYNPFDDFKTRYQAACQTLGVGADTDEYQVKLAYRKLAKKYHPDLNKEAGATERFQKINDAYEFLSKENIERYKRMAS